MSNQKKEIKSCIRLSLEEQMDGLLDSKGFRRRKNSLIYSRSIGDAVQKINIALEYHPIDERNAAAAVYPTYTVIIKRIEKLIQEMTLNDEQITKGVRSTLFGPIEWNSHAGHPARWYLYQPDSVPEVIAKLSKFVEKWTIPFFDKYQTVEDLCDAPHKGDNCVVNGHPQVLRVVAARVLCNQPERALELMEEQFGRPWPRKQYACVFDFLTALQG